MAKGESRNVIITVETETGKVLKVVDENGNEGQRVDPKEIEKIYNSEAGLKHVGLVLHAHSSPG